MKRLLTALALALLAISAMAGVASAGGDSDSAATVKGKVTLNEKSVRGKDVALAPSDPNAAEDESLRDQTNSKGSYTIASVPPGKYKVRLTTSLVPPQGGDDDRRSPSTGGLPPLGADIDCKIKGYSIFAITGRATPGTDTGPSPRSFVVVQATQKKAFTLKQGDTKEVNITIDCPSGTKIAVAPASTVPAPTSP
jgi:hypothetical protein